MVSACKMLMKSKKKNQYVNIHFIDFSFKIRLFEIQMWQQRISNLHWVGLLEFCNWNSSAHINSHCSPLTNDANWKICQMTVWHYWKWLGINVFIWLFFLWTKFELQTNRIWITHWRIDVHWMFENLICLQCDSE